MIGWLAVLVCTVGLVRGDDDSGKCARGGIYSQMFSKCYHLFYTPLNFPDAEMVCNGLHGRLVSIKSAFEQSLVYATAHTRFVSQDYWIGLHPDPDEPGVWVWTDGSYANYTNWAKDEPSSGSLGCGSTLAASGRWCSRDCNATKQYFVCEVSTREVQTEKCPGGLYNSLFGRCFYFMKSQQSYDDASLTCSSIEGVVVNIDNKLEEDFIAQQVLRANLPGDYWIGLRYENGNWKWSNSTENSYFNWGSGFPFNAAIMSCAAAFIETGLWYNTDCVGMLNSFVCETFVEEEAPTPDPGEWRYFNVTNCWYKVIYDVDLSWYDFESRCVAAKGHLASVHSDDENEFIKVMLEESYGFLGLKSSSGYPYKWSWSDGSALDYLNWYSSYPHGAYYCVAMFADWNTENKGSMDGFWQNDICDYDLAHHAGVCKRTSPP